MTDTKQYTHRQRQMTGPAVINAYDDVNDYYYRLGFLDNIRIRRETDNIYQSEFHVSRSVAIDGLAVAERWFCNFSVMERLNPDWQRLIFKDCGTPSIFGSCSLQTVTEEMRMFRNNAQSLTFKNGFWGDGILPAPTGVAGAAAGATGTIPGGTYAIVIEAVYTDAQGLNPVRSAHADDDPGTAVAGGQTLTVTWNAPVDNYIPAYYNIYEYDTALGQTRADADLIAIVLGTSPTAIIFDAFVDLGDWPGDVTGDAFVVTDNTGGTTFTAGDDYTIDTTCARLAILDDGDIEDGELLLVTYTYVANPYYQQTIGPGDRNPRILHLVIQWFKDDERVTPSGRGCEIHLYHVHAESGFEWLFDQMDFESGFDQEFRIMLDSATGKYGDIYTYHKNMETWELFELSNISDYTTDDECSLVSS